MEFGGSDRGGGGAGHGVPSFHDVFLGIEAGATLTGHGSSLSLADAAGAAFFVDAFLDHGAGYQFSFPTGYTQDVPALQGTGPDGPTAWDDPGRELNLPGIAQKAGTIEVLSWPHGETEPAPEFAIAHLAAEAGLERVDASLWHPSWSEISRSDARILSGAPVATPEERHKLPNGWYQRARGSTSFWRQFYRVRPQVSGVRRALEKAFNVMQEPPTDDHTFLIAVGAMWHYEHPAVACDDYETRVAFRVYSPPVYVPGVGYAHRRTSLERHWRAAQRLAQRLHDYLKAHPPSPSSVQFRRSLDPRLTHAAGPVAVNSASSGDAPSAQIRGVAATPNVVFSDQRGILVTVDCEVLGAAGQDCWVSAAFFDAGGLPLQDADGEYHNDAGCVSVRESFTADTQRFQTRRSLFIPDSQLHLSAGEHKLVCAVAVWKNEPAGNWTWLAGEGDIEFAVTTAGR